MAENEKKVLLSVKDLEVKFKVRNRILTAIRGISLDIYENEAIAIVGESGSGKSVFTKTFAGMLDSNGFISNGQIIFNDPDLAVTDVAIKPSVLRAVKSIKKRLDKYSSLEYGADIYKKILELKAEKKIKSTISEEERQVYDDKLKDLLFKRTEEFNLKQTYDSKKEKDKIKKSSAKLADFDAQIKAVKAEMAAKLARHRKAVAEDREYNNAYAEKLAALKADYEKAISAEITDETSQRNEIIAKEIYLSVGRYGFFKRHQLIWLLLKALREAMRLGLNLNDENTRSEVFDKTVFRVRYVSETEEKIHGVCVINLGNVKYGKDWAQIRGAKIATVFQDPMTSLNPIITIGKQITSIIIKHQKCSEVEARKRAIELMKKVGIPNAENRFDDYPFQYSGGMRQRIVIAIALSCQPKILICDEPTTALDVTIQAQILKLIKDLQKEFGYTIVFITHDLGVVANVADRVAVLYAGQVVEVGDVEEVFYDPRHPYTWALLSSLPQLAQRNTKLFSISGTPPSLYNKIVGDPFAPRNAYCLKIDTLKEPPMFKVSETHYAKTWLLDPRAPKVEKPEIIQNIHEKLIDAFNI